MAKSPAKPKTPPRDNDQVKVTFNIPVDKPSVYASNILIQPLEHEVLISFYEMQPPILPGVNEAENLAILRKVGLRADCVAKVTISKQRFEGFANAFRQAASDMKAAEKKITNA